MDLFHTTEGVMLGIEHFGDHSEPLVLLAGGTTMLSWPDRASVADFAAAGAEILGDDPAAAYREALLADHYPVRFEDW